MRTKDKKHDEPSAASLREMPEHDFSKASKSDRGYFHKKSLAAGGYSIPGPNGKGRTWIPAKGGRPKKGSGVEATSPQSIRLPESLWKYLEKEAQKRGMTRHALLRQIVSLWIAEGQTQKPRKRARKAA